MELRHVEEGDSRKSGHEVLADFVCIFEPEKHMAHPGSVKLVESRGACEPFSHGRVGTVTTWWLTTVRIMSHYWTP